MKRLTPLLLIVVLAVGGCAAKRLIDIAETPAQQRYAVLQIFAEYDTQALNFAQHPATTASVAFKLRSVRQVARAALDAMDEAFVQLELAQQELNKIQTPAAMDEARIRLTIFNQRMSTALDKVDAFVAIFKSVS